jgi:hypothetical protein
MTLLVIYGQLTADDQVQIYGSREGLRVLRDAVNRGLAFGQHVGHVINADGTAYSVQVNCKPDQAIQRMPVPHSCVSESSAVTDTELLNWIDANNAKIIPHDGWLTRITWGPWQAPKHASGKTVRDALIAAMSMSSNQLESVDQLMIDGAAA